MESQKPQEMKVMSEAEFVILLTAVRPEDRIAVLAKLTEAVRGGEAV